MHTIFLATVIGWFLVIVSTCLFYRHDYIKSIMSDVIQHPGLFYVAAIFTLVLGLLLVVSHNIWIMGWPVVVTLLSWLVLISGVFRLAMPEQAMKMGKSFLEHPMRIKITWLVFLIIGLFLLFNVYSYHVPLMP